MNQIRFELFLIIFQLTTCIFAASPEMVLIPGGNFQMGDHAGLGGEDPKHPSDEVPVHEVTIDSFFIGKFEITNSEYALFLNDALTSSLIKVVNGVVFLKNGSDTLFKTQTATSYSGILLDESTFKIVSNRDNHPVVCVRWEGAAFYCNWLSKTSDKEECYDTANWTCDFGKNGYHLPTEAQWEYTARGGQYEPYQILPWGNDENSDGTFANWSNSGDPYESGDYPHTTPVGFYDGTLHTKTQFNWPGEQHEYQTSNGSNGYGLFDISGNVWEFVNDWYSNRYYSISPHENPQGPTKNDASIVGDGKPYRTMRGGNWYNGHGGNQREFWGHGRIANRNPSHYRGPQDPNHPYYHVGFRIALNERTSTGINDTSLKPAQPDNNNVKITRIKNDGSLNITLDNSGSFGLTLYTLSGKLVAYWERDYLSKGNHTINFKQMKNGYLIKNSNTLYIYKIQFDQWKNSGIISIN